MRAPIARAVWLAPALALAVVGCAAAAAAPDAAVGQVGEVPEYPQRDGDADAGWRALISECHNVHPSGSLVIPLDDDLSDIFDLGLARESHLSHLALRPGRVCHSWKAPGPYTTRG